MRLVSRIAILPVPVLTLALAPTAGCFIPNDMSTPDDTGNDGRTSAAMSATMGDETGETGETTDGSATDSESTGNEETTAGEETTAAEGGTGNGMAWIDELVAAHCQRAAECTPGLDAAACELAWEEEFTSLQADCGGEPPDSTAVTACASDALVAACVGANLCGFEIPASCDDVFAGCASWIACAAP